jgi:hypothetical protein
LKKPRNITLKYLSTLSREERDRVLEHLTEEEKVRIRKERAEFVMERFQGEGIDRKTRLEGDEHLVEPLDALAGYSRVNRMGLLRDFPLTLELLETVFRTIKEKNIKPFPGDDRKIETVSKAMKDSSVTSFEYLDRINTYRLVVMWEGPDEENPFPGFICHYLFEHPVTENGHIFMEEIPGVGKRLEVLIYLPISANSWLPLAWEWADECGFIEGWDQIYYLRDDGYIASMDDVRQWLGQSGQGNY